MVNDKSYFTTTELAKELGISRVAVFKRIKKGAIPAEKVGNTYIIPKEYVEEFLNNKAPKELSDVEKEEITQTVKKIINEYGETLRLLGKE